MRFRIARTAEQDLDRIFAYWAGRASLVVAERLVDAIVDRFALLAEFPQAGRACNQIAGGVRCFPAGDYLIYYRKSRQTLEILHIFHGARNQPR